MKTTTLLARCGWAILVLTVLRSSLPAAEKLNDAFDYPDGPLVGASGSPWVAHSQWSNGPVAVVTGRILLRADQAEDINAPLAGDPVTTDAPAAVLYGAFTINVQELPTRSGAYVAHFRSGNTQRGRIWLSTADAVDGMFRLGIANSSSGDATSGPIPLDLETNADHRVVFRYDVATGLSSIGIDPTSEADLAVTAADEVGLTSINGFAFRQAAGMGALWVDDLVIGDRFDDVLGVTTMKLEIALDNGEIEISWPESESPLILEVSGNLDDPAWEGMAEGDVLVDGRHVVRMPAVPPARFFRLRPGSAPRVGP